MWQAWWWQAAGRRAGGRAAIPQGVGQTQRAALRRTTCLLSPVRPADTLTGDCGWEVAHALTTPPPSRCPPAICCCCCCAAGKVYAKINWRIPLVDPISEEPDFAERSTMQRFVQIVSANGAGRHVRVPRAIACRVLRALCGLCVAREGARTWPAPRRATRMQFSKAHLLRCVGPSPTLPRRPSQTVVSISVVGLTQPTTHACTTLSSGPPAPRRPVQRQQRLPALRGHLVGPCVWRCILPLSCAWPHPQGAQPCGGPTCGSKRCLLPALLPLHTRALPAARMQHCTRVLPAARMQHPTCCSPLPVLCTRYVLASKPDEYVFIYYLGNNDAWKGYGGATVYTRCERGARQEAARAGLRAGLALAGHLNTLAGGARGGAPGKTWDS